MLVIRLFSELGLPLLGRHLRQPRSLVESEQGNLTLSSVTTMGSKRGDEDGPTGAPPYSVFTSTQKWWIVFLVAFAGWFSTLSSFIYFPAIVAISADLNTSVESINLTVTSYLIVSAFVPSLIGNAADTIGRRPVYVVILSIYIVANIGLAVQSSFPALFVLRMIQSAGISGMPTF